MQNHFSWMIPISSYLLYLHPENVNQYVNGRFNLFLDPNATAIEHVLTFHSLIQLLFFIVIFVVIWIIRTPTRPSLDLRVLLLAGHFFLSIYAKFGIQSMLCVCCFRWCDHAWKFDYSCVSKITT